MHNVFEKSVMTAKEYGLDNDLLAGTNIAGFIRVADAMTAQGLV